MILHIYSPKKYDPPPLECNVSWLDLLRVVCLQGCYMEKQVCAGHHDITTRCKIPSYDAKADIEFHLKHTQSLGRVGDMVYALLKSLDAIRILDAV